MAEESTNREREYGSRDVRHVILDTSCIYKDYRLVEPETAFLLEHARNRNFRLCLPEVVVLEMVNHYREALRSANDTLAKTLGAVHRLLARSLGEPLSEVEFEDSIQAFDRAFRQLLAANNVSVEPIPSALRGVQVLLERDLQRRKPFADRRGAPKDRSGMRDAVLWESVLERCRREPQSLVVISNNSTDFADDSGERLHPHLINDLERNGIRREVVTYFKTIRDFNSAQLGHVNRAQRAGSSEVTEELPADEAPDAPVT